MRVLVFSQYWFPEKGVPQRRWQWLTRVLSEQGHEVLVISPPPHYSRNISIRDWIKGAGRRTSGHREKGPNGEMIVRTSFLPAGQSLTSRILNQFCVALGMLKYCIRPKVINEFGPDVLIGTVPALPTALITYLVAKRFGKSYIIDLRDAWPDLLSESKQWNKATANKSVRERIAGLGPLKLLTKFTSAALQLSLDRADAISVTSSSLQLNLQKRYSVSGRQKPIELVRNVFPPLGDEQFGIPKFPISNSIDESEMDSINVLYAGTIGRAQNLANAIDAVRIAKRRGVIVNLRLVGAGAAKRQLMAGSRDLGEQVQFLGQCPPESMVEHYEWADTALVHLTDWEPLDRAVPSKTYELMSMQIHICAVVSGETAEIVREQAAGDVVVPEDATALAELWEELTKSPYRLQIGSQGKKWVEAERNERAESTFMRMVENTILRVR